MTNSFPAETSTFYIHWPFCPYRCSYCSFMALARHEDLMQRYNAALCAEISQFGVANQSKRKIETLYIGGGTPSICPTPLLLDTFDTLNGSFDFDRSAEVTLEVNPGTATKEQMCAWRDIGINRLSIGVQSLNDTVLRNLNRHQSVAQVYALLKQACDLFDVLSVDFIIGLPGVGEKEWKRCMQEIVSWPIKHISIYFLTVHTPTQLYFDVLSKKVTLPVEDDVVDWYYWTVDFLKEHELLQYEISNFAKPGFQSRHNRRYWERRPYKGFGLGACSFDGKRRLQNKNNIVSYMEGIEKNDVVTEYVETLTEDQVRLEKIMLGLRQTKGMTREALSQGLSEQKLAVLNERISWLKLHRLLTECDGSIAATPRGLVLENDLAIRLFV